MALSMRTPLGLRAPAMSAVRSRTISVVCKAQAEEQSFASKLALPMATLALATCMMMSPDEALAARSSGRVGGSSGFKSRAAPSARSAPQQSRTTVNNTTIVSPGYAPPLFGGGFGYGGFGYSFMPSFVMPFPFFGGIFQFFFLLTIMSVVFSVIRGFMNSGSSSNKSNKKDDDSWGDL